MTTTVDLRRIWAKLTRKGQRPICLRLRSSVPFILLMASAAVFTDLFSYAVVVPVMPYALTERVGVAEDKVQFWTSFSLASFGAAMFVSSPFWGVLADRTSDRRTPMLFGLILLAAASLLLCFIKNVAMLIAGRILQGVCSALTWTVGMAFVVDTVAPGRLGKAMGWIGVANCLSTLSAPLLGGLVHDKGGYYAVWAMCFAVIVCDIVLRLMSIEKKNSARWALNVDDSQPDKLENPEDFKSRQQEAVQVHEVRTSRAHRTSGEGETAMRQPSYDSESLEEKRRQNVTFKDILRLFSSPRFLAALLGSMTEALILSAFDAVLPNYVKETYEWDSVGAGLAFLPLVAPTLLSPIAGHLSDRYGPRWISALGFALQAPFLVFLRFARDDTTSHKIMLGCFLIGIGTGVVCTFSSVTADISWAVEAKFEGRDPKPIAMGYALWNIASSAGSVVGPLLGGFVRKELGWPTMGWSLAIISAVTSILCAVFIGGPPLWKAQSRHIVEKN